MTQSYITQEKLMVEREVRARTAELEAALDAKTLLLHEVDHRVKNNLSMIGALLRLQASQIDDEAISTRINAMMERIDALAIIHRRLYQTDDIRSFDISAFLRTLVSDILGASGRADIALKSDIETIIVSSDRASPLGLILNEIVTNAVRHGFANGRAGTLHVVGRLEGENGVISISDDGWGAPSEAHTGGLGRTLINRLSRQIGARANWTNAVPGTNVTVTFPLRK